MKFSTLILILFSNVVFGQITAPKKEWRQLFNGKNLDGWDVKIRNYDLNDNFGKTFSVKKKKIVVNYDAYDKFNFRYGHLFFKENFSYYKIAVEYRFIGNQANEGEDWAFRNSGIMIHGQSAASMLKDQDFPISIEVQLLGGKSDGKPRPNCNLCTPGTEVVYENKLDQRHCINSTSKTYDGDQWVRAEVEVFGDSLIRHYVNGELVISYEKPTIGGGVVSGFDPFVKKDGMALTEGSISLQSESHPIEFRKVELLNLKGCMDPKAKNYKSYYVKEDNSGCRY
ncbi:DUF1080 domain-containing protein [Lacihabitans sp. LS3-19]|uniref:3-keto-disaccharide hydrolase n=1 Tax=Lacihabitans sp. LS3-19 TaxID=2487335 RepID=UPI0020CD3470|nr:DUF1080 domain-containing protein [Lacihabitans sp. LS3-19]MCP9766615.1 DUF1080 domain-containing protein [Lacihabitans sp. LS3-19]